MSTLNALVNAVLRSSSTSARESSTSLLTEVRRLPTLWDLMETDEDIALMRVVYRTGGLEDPGFNMMDLNMMNRVEDNLDRYIIRLVREYGFGQLEAEKFCDYSWNFRWVLLNTRTRHYSMDQSIAKILEAVDMSSNELVTGETGQ